MRVPRVRGRRLALAQERQGHGRLAASGALRRSGPAAARGRHVFLHHGDAQAARTGARAAAARRHGPPSRRDWAGAAAESSRMPGAQSRWSAGKDLSWEPLRIERVCEVKYDHMQGDRFRRPRSSCAGGRTSGRRTAATTSSRSRGPTSSSASSRRGRAAPGPDATRRERAAGSPGCASCCSGRASHRPGRRPRLKMRRAFGTPFFQRSSPAKRIFLALRLADFDQGRLLP